MDGMPSKETKLNTSLASASSGEHHFTYQQPSANATSHLATIVADEDLASTSAHQIETTNAAAPPKLAVTNKNKSILTIRQARQRAPLLKEKQQQQQQQSNDANNVTTTATSNNPTSVTSKPKKLVLVSHGDRWSVKSNTSTNSNTINNNNNNNTNNTNQKDGDIREVADEASLTSARSRVDVAHSAPEVFINPVADNRAAPGTSINNVSGSNKQNEAAIAAAAREHVKEKYGAAVAQLVNNTPSQSPIPFLNVRNDTSTAAAAAANKITSYSNVISYYLTGDPNGAAVDAHTNLLTGSHSHHDAANKLKRSIKVRDCTTWLKLSNDNVNGDAARNHAIYNQQQQQQQRLNLNQVSTSNINLNLNHINVILNRRVVRVNT